MPADRYQILTIVSGNMRPQSAPVHRYSASAMAYKLYYVHQWRDDSKSMNCFRMDSSGPTVLRPFTKIVGVPVMFNSWPSVVVFSTSWGVWGLAMQARKGSAFRPI